MPAQSAPRVRGTQAKSGKFRSPVGELIKHHRSRRSLSLRALGKLCDLSHPYLAAVERDKAKLGERKLEKIGKALDLSEDDKERLSQAAFDADPLVAPGYVVSIDRLISREEMEDVVEVWVGVRRPVEVDNPKYRAGVQGKMRQGCPYVYFLPDALVWRDLRASLVKGLEETTLDQLVTCIEVPAILAPFFYSTGFALYVCKGRNSHRVIGIIPFEGPRTKQIDCGAMTNDDTAYELHYTLKRVVQQARTGKTPVLFDERNRIELTLLHAPPFAKET